MNRRDPEALAAIKERFGFAHATTDWRDVIDLHPDIVALTGPGALRAEQATAALEAGIHVLAEKPFTIDPADAWAIDRLARDRGLHVVLCYAWNEMGITEHARRLIEGPDGIGDVEHVIGRDGDDRPRPPDRGHHLSRGRGRAAPPRRDMVRPGRVRRRLRARPAHACPRAGDAARARAPRDRRRGVHGRTRRTGRAPRRARHPLRGRRDRARSAGHRCRSGRSTASTSSRSASPGGGGRYSSTWPCRGSPARWAGQTWRSRCRTRTCAGRSIA